ncbi:sugar transporter SWEET1 [Neodiprion pinetum]|uniref:sugar transporter SWEET1 n=1 Tax=Neodiprion pinetum TaxID=441929 RepID=UPI001EDFED48|nr:sugar transporter SWEET1 [Neodiprion pinetum]XP_046468641.1 sugar transporter SWEET1 [Neodiprion pinetum]
MALEDYREIVATSAFLTTLAQMFAGVFVCKDIYKKGSAKGFPAMPFIGGFGMGIMTLKYGYILGDTPTISVNICGILLNVGYFLFYYAYSPDKTGTLALAGKVIAVLVAILGYAEMEHPDKIAYRFGIILTTVLFLLLSAPLLNIGTIIKSKSTEGMPFPLIFSGTLVTSQWLLYGFIIDNGFLIFQNAVAFTLLSAQLSLFVIYPSKSTKESESVPEKKKN